MFLSLFDGTGSLKKKIMESLCIRKLNAALCSICESEIFRFISQPCVFNMCTSVDTLLFVSRCAEDFKALYE